jgi:hypothetical protein
VEEVLARFNRRGHHHAVELFSLRALTSHVIENRAAPTRVHQEEEDSKTAVEKKKQEIEHSASYPNITLAVNVASAAPATLTNTATVSGGGETNTSNNSASYPTTINSSGGGGLSSGTYTITSGANAVDGGFGYWGNVPAVQFYKIISGNTMQQWNWFDSR